MPLMPLMVDSAFSKKLHTEIYEINCNYLHPGVLHTYFFFNASGVSKPKLINSLCHPFFQISFGFQMSTIALS
jgi:hypothetical protein